MQLEQVWALGQLRLLRRLALVGAVRQGTELEQTESIKLCLSTGFPPRGEWGNSPPLPLGPRA